MKNTQKRTLEIEKIKDEYIKKSFEDYFKGVKSHYTLFDGIDFKTFSERLKGLLEDESDERNTPILLSDDYFYSEKMSQKLDYFKEEIKDKSNSDLIDFDINTLWKELSNDYDTDEYFRECLTTIFNFDVTEQIKQSYTSYYISIDEINIYESLKIEDYDNFEEYKDDFENELYSVDNNELIKNYIFKYHNEVFKWFSDTKKTDEFNTKTEKEIKDLIKIEIPLRLKQERKNLKRNKEVTTILKEEFKKNIVHKENDKTNIENEIRKLKWIIKKDEK